MTATAMREILEREPFQPVRLKLTSGDAYDIRQPGLAMVLRTRVFVAAPNSDHWSLIPLIHIAAVETVNGGPPRGKSRRAN
jgi:hypothetical protein